MWKKIIYILSKQERRQLPLLMAEIIIGAVLETAGISVILPIVNILVQPEIVEGQGLLAALYRLLGVKNINQFAVVLMLFLIGFYLFKNVFLFIMHYHQFYFINKGQMILTERLINCYFSQSYAYFTKRNIADIQRNVASDVGRCYQTILSIITIITQACIAAAIILFLFLTDWAVTVIVLGMVLVFMLSFMKLTHRMLYRYGIDTRTYGARVIQWVNQSIGGIKEVKLFNREKYFKQKIKDCYSRSVSAETKTNVISSLPALMMETVCIVSIMTACIVRIKAGGDLTDFVSTLAAFALAAIRLLPAVGGISGKINMVTFNKASIDGIYGELVDLEKAGSNTDDDSWMQERTAEKMKFTDKIDVNNLTFRYEDVAENVLENVTMSIARGQSVAFVGPSGAGKTTFADLILGILEPVSGSVTVDGIPISMDIHSWYQQTGYIPQSIYLMDDTIRNNIAFGIDEKNIDDNKVWEALRKAQMETFVKKLPQGLDSNLGDRGVRCSGGQRQRIGIARALYNDPEFLILDEATSALDNDTEKAIMEAIDGLKGKKTLLIIAHRLSTTKNCDTVYRVENMGIRKER